MQEQLFYFRTLFICQTSLLTGSLLALTWHNYSSVGCFIVAMFILEKNMNLALPADILFSTWTVRWFSF